MTTQATQWFNNGDHPLDYEGMSEEDKEAGYEGAVVRRWRKPKQRGLYCLTCGSMFIDHGFIDQDIGQMVCPGDYIVTTAPDTYLAVKPDVFESTYKDNL